MRPHGGSSFLRPLALVVVFLAVSHARLLVVSQTSVGNGAGSLYTIQEMSSNEASSETVETVSSGPESLSGVVFGPIFSSPFAWLQQQLMIMEALQQAALQGLRPVMEAEPELQPAPSTHEMLRHVGCARMRAAMLDQMARERAWAEAEAEQGPAVSAGAMSARSAALTAATRHASAADNDIAVAYDDNDDGYDDDDEYYYEYYEDYGTSQKQQGMIASMIAGTVGHMLRGAFADAAAAAEAHASAAQQQQQQLQLLQQQQLQQRAVSREELEDRIASKAALRIAAALDAAGGVARLGYEDGEGDVELVMSSSGSKAAARSARDSLTSMYEYEDEAEDDEEDEYGEVADLAEAMLSNLDALLSGKDENDEDEEKQEPATSKGEYLREQQKKQKAALATRMASTSSSSASRASVSDLDDESDDAWEDYLEQYYAYYSIYSDGGEDEEDIYDSYYESYLDPYGEAPDALDMLASLAELIAWSSHTGSLVLHLFPIGGVLSGGGSSAAAAAAAAQQQQLSPAQLQLLQLQHLREQSDAAEVAQARAALLFPGQPYDPAAVADPIALLLGPSEDTDGSAGTIIISDLNLAWFNPDGSLNWGLVTLLILTAGTLAMAVGFVVSWVSLRRTMRTAAVYPGGAAACRRACARRAAAAKAAGSYSDGSECDSLDNPLLLLPEDCYGAEPLKIECASTYVPPVLPNESVAKVLYK